MSVSVIYIIIYLLVFSLPLVSNSHSSMGAENLSELFEGAYKVYELARNEIGMYRDSILLDGGQPYHPASTAAIGMGMIATCIASDMHWISQQEAIANITLTLSSLSHKTPGFTPDTNSCGFIRHFFNMDTGKNEWDSEYSTIDTALLMSGALFARNWTRVNGIEGFKEIESLVDGLWKGINWTKFVADPSTGLFYMILDENCVGLQNSTLHPFNEYMIVAYYAYEQELQAGVSLAGTALWNKYYSSTNYLPIIKYKDYPLLFDNHQGYLSSFVIQFTYYHIRRFRGSKDYMGYLLNGMSGDREWWLTKQDDEYIWGLGAGAGVEVGYHADAIDRNPSLVISPHIVGGSIPFLERAKSDLEDMLRNQVGIYKLPNREGNTYTTNNINNTIDTYSTNKEYNILWRRSLVNRTWKANSVQLIDYSTMLFGLAFLDNHCGKSYFDTFHCLPEDKGNKDKDTSVWLIVALVGGGMVIALAILITIRYYIIKKKRKKTVKLKQSFIDTSDLL